MAVKTMSTEQKQSSVLLIRNAAAYDFGGAERFVIALASELGRAGWHAVVATAHSRIRSEATKEGVETIACPWLARQDYSGWRILLTPLYILWQCFLTGWYIRLILKLKPDVVHPQSKDDFIAATLAARLLHKRVIWTDHADLKYVYQNVRVWYKNPVGKLVRFASRYAQAITAVSNSERQLIQQALGTPLPDAYTVVYNGAFDQQPDPICREVADREAIVFCCTSRLVTAKGIGELLQAFLSMATPGMRLWLVGDGPEEATFRQQAGNDTRIRFIGFSSDALRRLAAADIFIHPSYHEGFSLSIVEAAMLGKPIITGNTGGNPEIVTDGKTGLLVPVKDVAALAAAMRTLADDAALRKRLGSGARKAYAAQFRFDAIVRERFIPLYEV